MSLHAVVTSASIDKQLFFSEKKSVLTTEFG